MYYYKCSTQNKEIAKFCCACGTQLKTDLFSSNPYKKIILVDCGRNKISAIKKIRMLTGAGLTKAKNLSERTPATLKEGVSESEANQIKSTFTAIGAIIEIR